MLDFGRFSDRIIATRDIPAREARHVDIPCTMHPALRAALQQQGIEQFYSHQAEMFEAVGRGAQVVITTGTASGKSLSFLAPVLQAMLEDPSTRALLLYPTKALGRDQLRALQELIEEVQQADADGPRLEAGVFDGDTPPAQRRWVREKANLVLTNPDMLNAGLLPAHGRQGYAHIFRHVRFIVVDEMHIYRGAFGAHFSNLMRRLLRICRHYGSQPQFLCSSATIANPQELAGRLCHREFELIDRDGSPSSGQRIYFWMPPLMDSGARRGVGAEMAAFLPHLIRQRVKTIAFCRGRKQTEVVLKEARDRLRQVDRDHDESRLLAAYRGGYTPVERRKVEQDLIHGRLLAVVSTNALELGIDIGSLEVVVQGGFPGTRASFWQQIGRAGRRGRMAHAIVMLAMNPLDQYIGQDQEWLVGQPTENAVVDPDNLTVQLAHIRSAAAELPLTIDDAASWPDLGEVIPVLEEAGELSSVYGAWHWSGGPFPAGDFSLRNTDGDRFKIVNRQTGDTLTEMTRPQVYREGHTRAVYLHDGRQYQVEKLDLVGHVATVVPVQQNFYTQPDVRTQIEVLVTQERVAAGETSALFGDVRVDDTVVGYKMLQFHSHQNLGYEKLQQELPFKLETEAVWWPVPPAVLAALGTADRDTLQGLIHAIRAVARMRTMAERGDLLGSSFSTTDAASRVTQTALVLYDNHPGGIGFAAKAFEMAEPILVDALKMVADCPCKGGCPACVGDYALDRAKVHWALASFLERQAAPAIERSVAPPHAWQDLPGCWPAVRAALKAEDQPGSELLGHVEQVKIQGNKLILEAPSEGVADWIEQPEIQQQLRALLASQLALPSRWRLTAEAPEGNELAHHKLRRRLEDFKLGTATTERAADEKLASGFLLRE